MATVFKTFLNNDTTTTRTLLHEAIPLTGSILSGTYQEGAVGTNLKDYAHGMFQSVYDYPYLSSSANHIFDISAGFHPNANPAAPTGYNMESKKNNIYNQMAQVLVGHDINGSIKVFDLDGETGGEDQMYHALFMNFSRLLTKDEIKKGSFRLSLMTSSATPSKGDTVVVGDYGAATDWKIDSPAGEYGLLLTSSASHTKFAVGHVYYQAGVAVLTSSIFDGVTNFVRGGNTTIGRGSILTSMTGATIQDIADGLRYRISDVQFNNTTELNSTIYFCRANHNDFNYSSNPTYVEGSKIVVKENTLDSPISYITTVGLYSADNELLATAKLSEPLKKTPESEFTIRVRLDY